MVLDLDYVMDAAALSAFLTRPVFGLKWEVVLHLAEASLPFSWRYNRKHSPAYDESCSNSLLLAKIWPPCGPRTISHIKWLKYTNVSVAISAPSSGCNQMEMVPGPSVICNQLTQLITHGDIISYS
jgi:hypothetical protein